MDIFKSVFSEPVSSPSPSPSPSPPSSPNSPNPSSSWQFGSTLFKTLASKSESLLDNYYKDFQDFSSGLTRETLVIREVATRAVQDLPGRFESGAAIAQESLEAVGQAIDDVGSTVSGIIGKDLNFPNLRLNDQSDDNSGTSSSGGYRDTDSKFKGDNVKPYNRFEAMIRAVQCDVGTYCNEVDGGDYHDWKIRFSVEDKREEIDRLMEENDGIKMIYNEVVPRQVDEETFWCRYFYKVDEVVKAEEARLRIVKRAFSGEDEEELSWDVDDDDNEDNEDNEDKWKNDVGGKGKGVENAEKEGKGRDEKDDASASATKGDVVVDDERLISNEKEGSDGKIGSDISVISSQRSEDDIGWDKMEDVGSADESRVGEGGSVSSHGNRVKNAEDELLAWDIEDDD